MFQLRELEEEIPPGWIGLRARNGVGMGVQFACYVEGLNVKWK